MHVIRLAAIVTLVGSAGCAGAPPAGAPMAPAAPAFHSRSESGIAPQFESLLASRAFSVSPETSKTSSGLYVSDFGTKAVEILNNKTYAKVGTIKDGLRGPDGDWIDAQGNLYVANYKARNVTEYAPGGTTPSCTYSNRLRNPIDVTTDAGGNVFVVDWNFGGEGGVSYIDEYKQCVNTVANRYAVPGGAQGAALDSSGDLFVSYLTSGSQGATGAFAEYPAGSTKPKLLGATYGYPGGLVIDSSGNLVVCDQTGGTVDVAAPPYTTITSKFSGFSGPFHVGLSERESLIFVADPVAGNVTILTYPEGIFKRTLGKKQGLQEPVGVSDAPNAVL